MRYLMTQSLLASWEYQWSNFEKYNERAEEFQEKAWNDFLSTLRRKPIPTSGAMQNGIDFENLVTDIILGHGDPTHRWYNAAYEVARDVQGGQLQLVATKEVTVAGLCFLLYGRLDCLKAGIISDIKFSSKYDVGKFFGSPQHPMYMELVPEAHEFTYIISNGSRVWHETYQREECGSIFDTIQEFIEYLKMVGLLPLYKELWQIKNKTN